MKKRRIAIASILKPCDDVRAYNRMAKTLADSGFEVYSIGTAPSAKSTSDDVHFLSIGTFSRLSLSRLLAPLKVLQNIREVKPELLIVNTHELLIVAFLNRIFFGARILYDVQENYKLNLLHTKAFPPVIRQLLAAWVRFKERIFSPAFDGIILAEKCYLNELPFVSKNSVVIENKTELPNGFTRQPSGDLILAFTGTLGESTGVMEAIRFTQQLHGENPRVELHIAGHCARESELRKIRELIGESRFIKLMASDRPVPHGEILALISRAHFGIISYPPSPHTANRIPTKLFEYLSARLPIIIANNPAWIAITDPINAAITVDFANPDLKAITSAMSSKQFYTGSVDEFRWRGEGQRLVEFLGRLDN